jgi:hypothetical protein
LISTERLRWRRKWESLSLRIADDLVPIRCDSINPFVHADVSQLRQSLLRGLAFGKRRFSPGPKSVAPQHVQFVGCQRSAHGLSGKRECPQRALRIHYTLPARKRQLLSSFTDRTRGPGLSSGAVNRPGPRWRAGRPGRRRPRGRHRRFRQSG